MYCRQERRAHETQEEPEIDQWAIQRCHGEDRQERLGYVSLARWPRIQGQDHVA